MRGAVLALAAAAAADDSLSFLAIGDWGGNSDSAPTTTGELHNGAGMAKVASQLGDAKFVLAVGDNFYSSGIQGDDHSKRFHETFEAAFPQPELQCPWYVVAGNHDHKGNVSAQIAYSQDSKRWNFPSHYYTFNHSAGGVTTQIVYIDTVVIAGMSYQNEVTGEFVENEYHPAQEMEELQLQWLEETLKASTADYLWVSGHYPVYSQCSHGPTSKIILTVLPLMRKYKASGFIAGHDHCLGHYAAGPKDGSMAFVVSGAGKECCYSPEHINSTMNAGELKFRMDGDEKHGSDGGFASFTATAASTTIRYYKSDGTLLYTADPVAPRSAA
eukprot:TRINITY_DN35567_c0_g1_i1.p1 TRINITY_DN35567_c0_g1~~TRINITY_DN35567_c0_g1_i1.p1  ORF type:complete len:349 (+),score=140.68 TRINITY_DN35567_c0_g1_i1:63-1049(+)